MALLKPDKLFARITAIDINRDLLKVGLNAVLLDVDNTLRSRETYEIPHDVGVWLAEARDAGVKFCLLSNNWHKDVLEFADSIELPIVAKAMKPLPFAYLAALRKLNAKASSAVSVGDQLFTDVVGAHVVNIAAYMVLPLAEIDPKHTKIFRTIERSVIGQLEPYPQPTCQ